MKIKSSFYFLLLLGLVFPVLFGGCSSDPVLDSDDPGQVPLTFSVGVSPASRAAFSPGTPVRVYVYQRSGDASGVADFSVAPFKSAEGKSSVGSGNLSVIALTSGDLDANGNLTVPGDYTYDFVVVANGAGVPGFGTLNAGLMKGFSHGSDILAGRKEGVEIAVGQTAVNVIFTEYGADAQGNLPHLCCAVLTEGCATQALIDHLNGSFDYAVSGMDFKQCLPKSANLSFSGDPLALNVQGSGYSTSYSPSITGSTVTVSAPATTALSKDGYLLPYPLKTQGQDYNVLSIDFRLRVNGGDVLLSATGVHVPEFKPGFRYRFITELDHDPEAVFGKINLRLSVESWNSVEWESGMGEGETHSWMYLELGRWDSVTWHHVMGEGGSTDNIITTVSGWKSATWGTEMGSYQ